MIEHDAITADQIESSMLKLAHERGHAKSFCPSEVARTIAGDHPDHWGPLDFKGVYRLSLPRED